MFNTRTLIGQDYSNGFQTRWEASLDQEQELMNRDMELVQKEIDEHNESEDFIW